MVGENKGSGLGPQENSAEKFPKPKEGQIWQLKSKFRKPEDQGLFTVLKINNAGGGNKERFSLARLKEGGKRVGRPASVPLPMLKYRYELVAESEKDLDPSLLNKKENPVDGMEAPEEKEETSSSPKPEKLTPESESESLEPEGEPREAEKEEGTRITKADFERAEEDFMKKLDKGEITSTEVGNSVLGQLGFQEGDQIVMRYKNQERKGSIEKGKYGLGVRDEVGNTINPLVIFEYDANASIEKVGSIPSATEVSEPEPAPEPTPEPGPQSAEPTPDTEAGLEGEIKVGDFIQWTSNGVDQFDEPKKIREVVEDPTHGKFVFVEGNTTGIPLGEVVVVTLAEPGLVDSERRELTPEQKRRAELEKQLEDARRAFIEDDYKHSTKTSWLAKTLGVKTEIEREAVYKEDYEKTLRAFMEYERKELEAKSFASEEEKNEAVKSFLLRYGFEEKIALYTLGSTVKFESEQETWHGKAREHLARIANGYRHLSWKKKLAIGAGVVGVSAVSAGAGAAAAGVAGALLVTKRAVAAAAGYLAAEEGFNKAVDWAQKRGETKRIESLIHQEKDLTTLLNAVDQKISSLDEELQKRKKWGKAGKIAAFSAAIGLPVALSQADWFHLGEGRVNPDAPSETAQAVDHQALETPTPVAPTEEIPNESIGEPTPPVVPESATPQVPENAEGVPPVEGGESVESPSETRQKIIIGEPDTPLSERERYWINRRNMQGLYTDADEVEPEGYENNQGWQPPAGPPPNYSPPYEEGARLHPASFEVPVDNEGPHTVAQAEAMIAQDEVASPSAPENLLEGTPYDTAGSAGETAPVSTPEPLVEAQAPRKIPVTDLNQVVPAETDTLSQSDASGYEATPEQSASFQNASIGEQDSLSTRENFVGEYSYEDSKYQNLPTEHRALWRENMTLLHNELLVMDHPEFGPDYRPGGWKSAELWRQYKDDSIQDIVYFDQARFDRDPRDLFRDRLEERWYNRTRYFPRLPERYPYPTWSDGPDADAIHSMDKVDQGFLYGIADMQRAAFKTFGNPGLPINGRESVQQYMARIATLYTRARLENPEFRLKF